MKLPKATQEEVRRINSSWKDILKKMPQMYIACLNTAQLSVRPSDGKLVIRFIDDTIMSLCDEEDFREELDKAFAEVTGKEVDYELISGTKAEEEGQYFPPASMFGMEVEVDDTEFE